MNNTQKNQEQAEQIRIQYIRRDANKMEQLKKLDDKVKAPGRIISSILGVIGALAMGAGMSLVMVWGNMLTGLDLSIAGMLVALLAYPVYYAITNRRKKSYGAEIIRLSDEVLSV